MQRSTEADKNLGLSNDKGNNVHCSLEDKAGNLWFGTTGDGLLNMTLRLRSGQAEKRLLNSQRPTD